MAAQTSYRVERINELIHRERGNSSRQQAVSIKIKTNIIINKPSSGGFASEGM